MSPLRCASVEMTVFSYTARHCKRYKHVTRYASVDMTVFSCRHFQSI
ncbi:MAG: hypothetical protein LBT42_02485 [Tannerella sp.]|nr:hypothetical protein [Tannerella sp.]